MDSATLDLDKNQDEMQVFHLISRFKESIFLSILRINGSDSFDGSTARTWLP